MFRLSHIQIKVVNIKKGIDDFEKLGFKVERGGKKSRNAFIWFEDGPFIELLEMHKQDMIFRWIFGLIYGKAMNGRWKKWCSEGEGMIDFAIEPSDKEKLDIKNFPMIRKEIMQLGFKPARVITWSRKNIRGERVCFSYLPVLPEELPFIVSGYDIPQRPKSIKHMNGVKRITGIKLVCSEKGYKGYKKIAEYDPCIEVQKGNGFKIETIYIEGVNREFLDKMLHSAVLKYKEN